LKDIITENGCDFSAGKYKHENLPNQMRHAHAESMGNSVQSVISLLIPVNIKPHETLLAIAELLQSDAARFLAVKLA